MTAPWNAYHCVGERLRDGRPVPAIGETLRHEGPVEWCESGLYASRTAWDAFKCAPSRATHLCRVRCDRIEREGIDKLVCRERTIVAMVDARPIFARFARACALDVIHLWDAPDVVVRFLKTGDEALRAEALAAVGVAPAHRSSQAVEKAAWAAWAAGRCGVPWAAASAASMAVPVALARHRFTAMTGAAFKAAA